MNEIPLHMYYNVQANGIWKFYPTMLVGPWQFISKVGHRVLKGQYYVSASPWICNPDVVNLT
jgi:hypothetical protein